MTFTPTCLPTRVRLHFRTTCPQAPVHVHRQADPQPRHMRLTHTQACTQIDTCLQSPPPTWVRGQSSGTRVHTQPLWEAARPGPRLSGVLGTAGTVPTHRNRHSRRIASASNFSSAVQMMIKCYCARENGKEGFISFIVRKDSVGSSSRLQGWLNPLCAGGIAL